jgi:hypothetical protein
MRKRDFALAASVVVCFLLGCSDGGAPAGPTMNAPNSLRANVGGFGCAVTYNAITQTNETELQPYGVEPVTDTARICEQWTGSDYSAEVTQIGSSEPPSDYHEDMGTVVYQAGTTTPYDFAPSQMESSDPVGSTSFEFVAATSDERQASYNDPYYAVIADPDPVHCSNPPCAAMSRSDGTASPATVSTSSAHADLVPIPLRRPVLLALLRNATELGLSPEGFRRFQKTYPTGETLILSIDPVTELIRRQEISSTAGSTTADLTWSIQNGKFVREQMDIVSEDIQGSKKFTSHTKILLRNVHWDPTLVH